MIVFKKSLVDSQKVDFFYDICLSPFFSINLNANKLYTRDTGPS